MHRLVHVFAFVVLAIVSPPGRAEATTVPWHGSPVLEPGLGRQDVLLFEDFEQADYPNRWLTWFDSAAGAGLVAGPAPQVFAGRRSAYLQAQAGQHASLGTGEYVPAAPLEGEAFLRLYLRLDERFSMGTCARLKLFGINAGASVENTYGGAGHRPNGQDKFSVTLGIDRASQLNVYVYHPEQHDGWGDTAYCNGFFCSAGIDPGRWYCLELMLKPNTPGRRDGAIKAWLDTEPVIDLDGLRLRDADTVKIRRFPVMNYFGGSGGWNTSPQDQRTYVDNLVISRKRIGCLGAMPR
ncbi:MAG: polysaccharide lyase [Gammaproteobacteria bacterium]